MCIRIVLSFDHDNALTGRGMDWNESIPADIVLFPRGITYSSRSGEKPLSWTSQFASIIVYCYHLGGADGMNEKGLSVNLLYLVESEYSMNKNNYDLSVLQWVQFTLDSFSSVTEAVNFYQTHPMNIISAQTPNSRPLSCHLSLSDSTGDSAILEYISGRLVIHHGKEYKVMTNSPIYDEQLALLKYWKNINGMNFLPGTISSPDRFIRASFLLDCIMQNKTLDKSYEDALIKKTFHSQSLASLLGLVRSMGTPLGCKNQDKPNIAATLFRTIADQTHMIYYFDSSTTPNIFWIDLKAFDLDNIKNHKAILNVHNTSFSGQVCDLFTDYKLSN